MPGLAIALIQGDLLFFNAEHVQDRLCAIADKMPPGTRWLILDASAITQVDSTVPLRRLGRCAPTSPAVASPSASRSCTPRSGACSSGPG